MDLRLSVAHTHDRSGTKCLHAQAVMADFGGFDQSIQGTLDTFPVVCI